MPVVREPPVIMASVEIDPVYRDTIVLRLCVPVPACGICGVPYEWVRTVEPYPPVTVYRAACQPNCGCWKRGDVK